MKLSALFSVALLASSSLMVTGCPSKTAPVTRATPSDYDKTATAQASRRSVLDAAVRARFIDSYEKTDNRVVTINVSVNAFGALAPVTREDIARAASGYFFANPSYGAVSIVDSASGREVAVFIRDRLTVHFQVDEK